MNFSNGTLIVIFTLLLFKLPLYQFHQFSDFALVSNAEFECESLHVLPQILLAHDLQHLRAKVLVYVYFEFEDTRHRLLRNALQVALEP